MFKKNTASQFIHFQGIDATTGGIKAGVTWTVRRCIDGTFAAAGGTATEDGSTGWYKFAMAQADTNGNNIGFNFTGTGAVPQTVNIVTDGAPPDVNTKTVGGTTQTAGDLAALITAVDDFVDTEVAAIKAKTDNLPSDPADASDIAAAFSTVNSTLATVAGYIDTEVAAIKAKTDNLPASPAAVGSAMTLTSAYDFAKGTVAMTESYNADGAAPTPVQAIMLVLQMATEKAITSTTVTVKKLDGTTTAATFTLDSATTPTSITRAT